MNQRLLFSNLVDRKQQTWVIQFWIVEYYLTCTLSILSFLNTSLYGLVYLV